MNNITDHIARAKALLAAGFTTKAAQQDALDQLNRGFEKARNWAHDRQIEEAPAAGEGGWSEERNTFFNERDLPFQLNHIRDRHLPVLAEFVPGLDNIVSELVELRNEIKAAPVVKAPAKAPVVAAPEEKRMTCQCCGRPIQANTGKIAHHGYQRPGLGWQTASCEGAKELPFEVSRDALGRYIERLNRRHDSLVERQRQHADQEIVSLTLAVADYDLSITRGSGRSRPTIFIRELSAETFEAKKAEHPRTFSTLSLRSFEDVLARDLREINQELSLILTILEHEEKRYNGWKQTHSWDGEAFVPA